MPPSTNVLLLGLGLGLLILCLLIWRLIRRVASRQSPVDEAYGADADSTRSSSTLSSEQVGAVDEEVSAYRKASAEALQRLHAIAFGAEWADGAAGPPGQEPLVKSVRTRLVQIIDQPNYAPRRPMLLPRLIQAMRDDDVSRRELARIIATDPVLAGNLVRLANSPVYRHSEAPIESLDRAVAVLGTEGMRSLTTAALLQPVFRISGRYFARFGEITWQHTFLCASGAEAHAAVIENSDPFAAQLLGLITGLATIVVFRVANDAYLERRKVPVASTIAALIDSEVVPVARQIAASWELSERMDVALADQTRAASAEQSSLGRSLQFGRFAAALAMLRSRTLMDEEAVSAALRTGGPQADAYTRIYTRLLASAS